MTQCRITARSVFSICSFLAGIGLLLPGSPAYLPLLLSRYSHYQGGHSLAYWVRALHQPDAELRLQAILAVGTIGSEAAEAVPALAEILTDDADDEARHQAALALAKIAPASAAAVPALARALDEDKVLMVRMDAAMALSRLGANARPAVPALIRAMHCRANRTNLAKFTLTIQEMAAVALAQATAGTRGGVAALMEALQGARTANKRRILAHALGEVGTPAREAEPLLRTFLADESPEVREAVREALRKIGAGPKESEA